MINLYAGPHDCITNLCGISDTAYLCYCGSQHEIQAVESHNNHETAIYNSCKHSLINRAVTIWQNKLDV